MCLRLERPYIVLACQAHILVYTYPEEEEKEKAAGNEEKEKKTKKKKQ